MQREILGRVPRDAATVRIETRPVEIVTIFIRLAACENAAFNFDPPKAGPNQTGRPRSVMTIVTMDKDMRLKAPANRNQQIDWAIWCPGAKIGEVIDTPKNPLLYERVSATG